LIFDLSSAKGETVSNLYICPFLSMHSAKKKIIIITAPSGSGKTSVVRHLLEQMPDKLAFSISAATRKPRGHEKDKEDYYFISADEFEKRIENNEFVEWEMVYEGKYYGTLKSELERIWQQGKTPLLDVDVKGGVYIQQQYPNSSLSLFIEPPSIEELERRLRARGTESDNSIKYRVSKASYEMTFKDKFDEVVINEDLQKACKDAEKIIRKFLES